MGAMRELLEANGYTVRGFGPTTGSVRALREAGIEATTVAALLARSMHPGEDNGAVWIVDESSLLATRHVNTLLHQARAAQVARVIFVGDQRQHGAVEAGRPIAQLEHAGMETARLDIIRRQRDPELRKAVALAAKGATTPAVELLLAQGRVTEIDKPEDRAAAIAQAYVRSMEAGQPVLVVSPANAERTALNTAIRKTLQERGLVSATGTTHAVLINRSVTGAERAWARSYQSGDVVRYRSGSKKFTLVPGSYARVTAVDAEHNQLTVRTDSGMTHTYTPSKLRGVEVYREETREFAVGDRIQFRAPLKVHQIPNGALGTITAFDQDKGQVTIALDAGPMFSTLFLTLRHIEYGYATTSHSSQGATIDRVLVNVDTGQSVALVNQQQFYVSISRARVDAQVFTNKKEELAQAVNRAWPKSTALDAVMRSDDASRFSQRREKSAKHRALVLSAAREQHSTVLSLHPVHVSVSHRESTARPGDERHPLDAALRVSHHQTEWRREQQHPRHEQTVARAPAHRRDERPVPPGEVSQHQPERSHGIRYRR
jgi:ATP-dependent exoDNAse (exonuclease V) alpha subunit